MDKSVADYYYIFKYECIECGRIIDEDELEEHVKECLGEDELK